jgi:hypothetical protein
MAESRLFGIANCSHRKSTAAHESGDPANPNGGCPLGRASSRWTLAIETIALAVIQAGRSFGEARRLLRQSWN